MIFIVWPCLLLLFSFSFTNSSPNDQPTQNAINRKRHSGIVLNFIEFETIVNEKRGKRTFNTRNMCEQYFYSTNAMFVL